MLAAAYRVATWLLLPSISLGYTECIHSRSVIEFRTCHGQLNCVFCKAHGQHLQRFYLEVLENYHDVRGWILAPVRTLNYIGAINSLLVVLKHEKKRRVDLNLPKVQYVIYLDMLINK